MNRFKYVRCDTFDFFIALWNAGTYDGFSFPRSLWLGAVERELQAFYPYPASSSADRRLTARHSAPFFLKDGPNVP